VRKVALIVILLVAFAPGESDAARKKSRRSRRRAVPAAPAELAVGDTLEERLQSLVNGKTARSADTSIQIVEIESGEVVAERNAHVPLAPASNMKLFTTAAAIDLLHPDFEVTSWFAAMSIRAERSPAT
jgi:D-alanyl-D-alanine carboxypeptidase